MSDSSYFSERIKEYQSEHGFFKTIGWIIAKLLKRIWRSIYQGVDYNLGVFSFDEEVIADLPNDSDVLCREMRKEDLCKIKDTFDDSLANTFSGRLINSTGYIVYCADQAAGYAWSSSTLLRNEGIAPFLVNLLPHDKTIYIFDCFTLPEYRNKKVFSRLLTYLLMEMKQQGYEKAFLTVRTDNSPMLKVIDRHGFKIEGEIKCRKYLFFKSIKNDAFAKVCTVVP